MEGGALNARRFFSLATTLVGLAFAVGCGSSGSDEVTVQTGSLSKAEFIAKADAICKAARTEFLAKFEGFAKSHEIGNKAKEEATFDELLDSLVEPNVEGEIAKISVLGASEEYAPEVEAFLSALQERLDKASEEPTNLSATPYPFKEAEDTARKAGMNGCAESFS